MVYMKNIAHPLTRLKEVGRHDSQSAGCRPIRMRGMVNVRSGVRLHVFFKSPE